MWQELKRKQLYGYDFHRQKPLLNFIADFYCYELNLVIELDGFSRQIEEVLEKMSLTILRFNDGEMMKDINNVLKTLEGYVTDFEKHRLNPFQEGIKGE